MSIYYCQYTNKPQSEGDNSFLNVQKPNTIQIYKHYAEIWLCIDDNNDDEVNIVSCLIDHVKAADK